MISRNAYAKLNLNLHIIADRAHKTRTGYFPVHFINCELDLHDELYFENIPHDIKFECSDGNLSNESNSVYKAAHILKKIVGNSQLGVKITLKKHIPVLAGLGGGSSDGVACIRGLIELWNIKLSDNTRNKIISKLGTDVYYSWEEGVCEIEGVGDRVTKITNTLPLLYAIIVVPDRSKPSTKVMYDSLDMLFCGKNETKLYNLKIAIQKDTSDEIVHNLHNDFDQVAERLYPEHKKIKEDFIQSGADSVILAGSGLSVVGLFIDKLKSEMAYKKLQVIYNRCIWTKTK